jgi:hypothetical protein
MFNLPGKKRKRRRADPLEIESILQSSLKPVSPSPEFIRNLQKGLMEYSFPPDETTEIDLKKALVFAFLGFAGLVFVVSLWVRLIVVIISTLGMIQTSRQKKAPDS